MKKSILLVTVLFSIAIIFTSCTSKSGRKTAQQEQQKKEIAEPVVKPAETPVAAIPKGTTFTPEKVEVEPVYENSLYLIGEGQIPSTYYKAMIYFIAGDVESRLLLSEYYYNNPKDYDDSGEITGAAKERQAEKKKSWQAAKNCYKAITSSPFSDLIIYHKDGYVTAVKKRIAVTEKKDGNAFVRQDSVIQLYPY